MLLTELLPSLAAELQDLLIRRNRPELAAAVPSLRILDRCRCGDDFCASFYTMPKPDGKYPPHTEAIDLDAAEGMLILDVAEGSVAQVEVLYRDDVRKVLLKALP